MVLFNVRRLSGGKVVLFNGALSHVREIGWVLLANINTRLRV